MEIKFEIKLNYPKMDLSKIRPYSGGLDFLIEKISGLNLCQNFIKCEYIKKADEIEKQEALKKINLLI